MNLYERFGESPAGCRKLSDFNINHAEWSDPLYAIWLEPGLPAITMIDEECWRLLGDNAEYDILLPLPALSLVMNFGDRNLIDIEGAHFAAGPLILYAVDENGLLRSAGASDLCSVNQLMPQYTKVINEDGQSFCAIRFEGLETAA